MTKPTFRSWLAQLVGGETETKPETRARLDVLPLGTRILPTVMSGMSAICGSVYVDINCNGVRDSGEAGIAGVKVSLSGGGVCKDVLTDCNGNFSFANLGKGCYTLTETQPGGYKDGAECGPTAATANDQFGKISLDGSRKQGEYTFGELKQVPPCDNGGGTKGSKGKGSGGKGSAKKGSAKKGSGGKGSAKKGSGSKGSAKKASGSKGSKGKGGPVCAIPPKEVPCVVPPKEVPCVVPPKDVPCVVPPKNDGHCDIWSGYEPKQEPKCDQYDPCGYGYKPCNTDNGSSGKGSSSKGSRSKGSACKASGGKGSGGKGSAGKGSACKASGGKGSSGKGSAKKGSAKKGSSGKGSRGKGSNGKGDTATCLANLYGIGGKW